MVMLQNGIEYPEVEKATQPKISLFASSVRSNLWRNFFDSLEGISVDVEVVFAGPLDVVGKEGFKYIKTGNIKPAQCYEIARRHCTGELIHWTCDDAEYKGDILGKAYRYWKEQKNGKLILSLQTEENYGKMTLTDMNVHRFHGWDRKTPLMAPLNLMDRKYLEYLGGYDRRYICGQAENDIVMRAYITKGTCEIFGDENTYIEIDHIAKHGDDHHGRPFAKGYKSDRAVLESSWKKDMHGVYRLRSDVFEPFEDEDILTKSQSNNLPIWD